MQPNEATDPVVVREPDASKGARPVLRGEGGREASFLPSSLPEPAASASALPDMLANTTLCSTFTCASPPGKRPTTALQKRSSLSMMLPVLMMVAARMNSGMASSRKLE